MAQFQRAVLTTKGLALLAKTQTDDTPVTITACVSGSGTYEEGESLEDRTALKELKQTFAPTAISRQNDTNVWVRFSITNNPPSGPLERGYAVTEIGIIAEDPDEGDILYAIAIAAPGQSDYIPSYNGTLPAVIGVNFLIEVSNADEVIIDTDLTAYVTTDQMDVIKGQIEARIDAAEADIEGRISAAEQDIESRISTAEADIERRIEEAEKVFEEYNYKWGGEEEVETVFNQDGSITETTELGDKVTTFNQDGSITESYPDGRVLLTTFNQDGSISRRLRLLEQNEEEVQA